MFKLYLYILLSGFLSAITTVAILAVLRHFKFPVTIIAEKYVQFFVTGLVYGFFLAVLLYIRGGRAHIMAQNPFAMTGNCIYDFWMGREVNPQIGPFDVKVGLYRTGTIGVVSDFDYWLSFSVCLSLSHSVFDTCSTSCLCIMC
jgi:lamin-B receptor